MSDAAEVPSFFFLYRGWTVAFEYDAGRAARKRSTSARSEEGSCDWFVKDRTAHVWVHNKRPFGSPRFHGTVSHEAAHLATRVLRTLPCARTEENRAVIVGDLVEAIHRGLTTGEGGFAATESRLTSLSDL
jgi:hypothetical protein